MKCVKMPIVPKKSVEEIMTVLRRVARRVEAKTGKPVTVCAEHVSIEVDKEGITVCLDMDNIPENVRELCERSWTPIKIIVAFEA